MFGIKPGAFGFPVTVSNGVGQRSQNAPKWLPLKSAASGWGSRVGPEGAGY